MFRANIILNFIKMKKIKIFKLLSNNEQKTIFGGSTQANGKCCNPTNNCCFPVFGDPVQPATIDACGLISSSCDWWYSTANCCF